MSRSAGPGGRPTTRTAAAAVGLLVLVLVAVLVGLLRPGSDTAASPAPTARTGASSASAPGTRGPSPSSSVRGRDPETGLRVVALADLPRQAQDTVALIEKGGPYPYAQDGVTFGNNERLLPAHPRGWYHEYTVRTPGERDRGPRRIVTGDHDRQIFYTADHYATFVRVSP